MSKRSFTIALVVIVALATLIRVAAADRYGEIDLQTDALDYDRHAVSIAEGNGYPEATKFTGGPGPTAWRPPLFPYLLAGAYTVSGTEDERKRVSYGRIANALIGGGVVALIALIATQLWGRVEALIAAAFAAVYPPLITAGSTLLTEPLFTGLLLGGVAALLRYRARGPEEDGIRWLLLAGFLAGLSTLARTNGIVVIGALALGAWVLLPRFSLRALVPPAIVAASAALAIAPWTIRNAIEMDALVPLSTQTGFGVAGQYNDDAAANHATWVPPFHVPEYLPLFEREPTLGEVELDKRLTDLSIDYAVEHPDHVLSAGFWNGLRLLNLDDPVDYERYIARYASQPPTLAALSVYAFWLLAALTVAALLFAPPARRVPRFVWVIPLGLIVTSMFVAGFTRYRVPADPILILVAAAGAAFAWRRLLERRPKPAPGGPT